MSSYEFGVISSELKTQNSSTKNSELSAELTMVGIDIVDVSRMEGIMKRFGDRFLNKVFTDKELDYVRKRIRIQESLAGRFAAKEAFIKASGETAGLGR